MKKYIYAFLLLTGCLLSSVARAQPPCSGTPDAGITNVSTESICSGDSVDMVLSGLTSSGLMFQWQSSTDSINFFSLPGANDSSYSTSINQTTWFRCVVTCVSSGEGANSPKVKVSVDTIPNDATIGVSSFGLDYTFSVNNIVGTYTYIWDFGDGESDTAVNPTHTYIGAGSYDVSVQISNECAQDTLEYALTISVGVDEMTNDMGLKIFPNPTTSDFILISASGQQVEHLKILDVSGRVYWVQPSPVVLPVSFSVQSLKLERGSYLVQVDTKEKTSFMRLLVQ